MILLPLLFLILLPGVGIASVAVRRKLPEIAWFSVAGVCGILWSTLGSLILTTLRVPLSMPTLIVLSSAPLLVIGTSRGLRAMARATIRSISWDARNVLLWSATVAILALPLVTIQRGLPTGDVQKSLFWAEKILDDHQLPNYAEATALNRDPADFLTPGLHTLTAAVIAISGDPFRGSAAFSFAASTILAGLAAALAALLTEDRRAPLLAFLITALSFRFLRYAFAPGYHYQNLLGELLLLLALFAWIAAVHGREHEKRQRMVLLGLAGVSTLVLPLVHQFTAFLAVFLVGITIVASLVLRRDDIRGRWRRRPQAARRLGLAILVVIAGGVLTALRSPLAEKLSHFFTTTPHLQGFLIPLAEVPTLLGPSLVFLGIGGMILFAVELWSRKKRVAHWVATHAEDDRQGPRPKHSSIEPGYGVDRRRWGDPMRQDPSPQSARILLALWTLAILVLGQGPLFSLDIPSARTLFYATIPLAVFAALLIDRVLAAFGGARSPVHAGASIVLLALALAPFGQTAAGQLSATTHTARVNASVTPETLDLLRFLETHPPTDDATGVLTDDWNRRRLTWTILSPYRMLTRVGGDLRVIADEASQSSLRRSLYDHHLDFEKIFMLGNSPVIAHFLEEHSIRFIATTSGVTDDVFSGNPLLREVHRSSETTVYEYRPDTTRPADDPLAAFLLSPTTLVNDVGDQEDVLPHSALSIASTRLSDPRVDDGHTARVLERPETALRVNVGTYPLPLWDENRDGTLDGTFRLLLRGRGPAQGTVSADGRPLGTFRFPTSAATDVLLEIPRDTLTVDDTGFSDLTVELSSGALVLDLVAVGRNGYHP